VTGDTDNPGALYTRTWQAKRYVKKPGTSVPTSTMSIVAAADYTPAIDGAFTTCDDDSVAYWTNTNNHFGEVWYTPHDNSTDGHEWDEQTNVLIWNFYPGDGTDALTSRQVYNATPMVMAKAGNMNNAKYQKLMKVTETTFETKGQSQKEVSTVVRFINKQTGRSLWVTLKVPAKKMFFEYGVVGKKDWSHWFGFNSSVPGESAKNANKWAAWSDAEGVVYGSEFDAHINPFKPSNNNYNHLTVTDYNQLLTDNWLDPSAMVELQGGAQFTNFVSPNAPVISFLFTLPVKGVNSEKVTAVNGLWDVKGISGTVWTLQLAAHNGVANTAIVAVKKNGVAYGPEEICYIDEKLTVGGVDVAINNRIHMHGLEVTGDLYPAATDLVNKVGAYTKQGDARFNIGSGLNNLENALFLKDDVEETFTAYLKLDVHHTLCYDPLIGKNLFNVRVHRPINVVGKQYVWVDRNLNDNRLAIKDLVEVVDWNRFPVVAYNTDKISARNTMFGIEQPAYSTVYGNTTTMKAQNVGIPFEYYGITELAVRYDEIRTDHAKEPNIRLNIQDPESATFIANTDKVKDLNSLTSWREGNVLKTLSLLNANGSPVSFTTAHAYNHSDLNSTGKGTQYGWLYYNNNASVVQEFHLYVPIAVKYNWGNIAYDDRLGDAAGAKLDKDYTQTVWAIVTVKGTN